MEVVYEAQFLVQEMARANMTAAQLADESGIASSTISRITSGKTKNPNAETYEKLLQCLGTDMDAFTNYKHDQVITNMLEDGQNPVSITTIRKFYQQQQERAEKNYQDALEQMRIQNDQAIKELNQKNEDTIAELKTQYEQIIAQMQKQYTQETERIEERCTMQVENIEKNCSDLNEKNERHISDIKSFYEGQLSDLHDRIKKLSRDRSIWRAVAFLFLGMFIGQWVIDLMMGDRGFIRYITSVKNTGIAKLMNRG